MNINGWTVSWQQVTSALAVTFWLGTLSVVATSTAEELKDHKSKPSHDTVAVNVATIKQKLENNTKTIEEIKAELKEQSARMQENQREILQAIREQE